jgi:non-canonical purine NTP pyrophosphatase (RdgB/HAM1 family)
MPEIEILHSDIDLPEIQSLDPREVIEHKLHVAYPQIQKPCFVMDASLSIHALWWFPGPLIKRFYQSLWGEGICKLMDWYADRSCTWTVMMWVFNWTEIKFFEHKVDWMIAPKPLWLNGFSRDPIFMPQWSTKTFAEMETEKYRYASQEVMFDQFIQWYS